MLEKILQNYNKYSLPPSGEHFRTVEILPVILDLFDVSEYSSSFSVRYRLNQYWTDERLKYDQIQDAGRIKRVMKVPIDIVKEKSM